MKGNVYLVGLPGAGKTRAGHALARSLGLPFVDLDREIGKDAGVAHHEVLRVHGEDDFRDREARLLAVAASAPGPAVIACGGGVVLRKENRKLLRSTGTVVYLDAPISKLLKGSVVGSRSRPLLRSEEDLRRIAAEREPLYREVAHVRIAADAPPEEIATRVGEVLG